LTGRTNGTPQSRKSSTKDKDIFHQLAPFCSGFLALIISFIGLEILAGGLVLRRLAKRR
jgi:hypothetical protein